MPKYYWARPEGIDRRTGASCTMLSTATENVPARYWKVIEEAIPYQPAKEAVYDEDGITILEEATEEVQAVDAVLENDLVLMDSPRPDGYIPEEVNGVITGKWVDGVDHEAVRKEALEIGAFLQQNNILDQNMLQLYWKVVDKDLTNCPKMLIYTVFVNDLWTEYHTRKATDSVDYDFSTIVPAEEYGFLELKTEVETNII